MDKHDLLVYLNSLVGKCRRMKIDKITERQKHNLESGIHLIGYTLGDIEDSDKRRGK